MQNVQKFYACPMTAPPSSQKQGHYHCKNQSYKTEASWKISFEKILASGKQEKKPQESDSMPQIGILR